MLESMQNECCKDCLAVTSSIQNLTCPSIADMAELAASSQVKFTKPNPLDLPVSLSTIILTAYRQLSQYIKGRNYFKQKVTVLYILVH